MVYRQQEIRRRKNMTQDALSKASRINRVTIAKYETGKMTPTLKSAVKIAHALGVTIDELIRPENGGCEAHDQSESSQESVSA